MAGRRSMVQRPKLDKLAAAVGERVAALKRELESDGAAAERQQQKRRLRQAEAKAARIRRVQGKLAELEQEHAGRAKDHAKAAAEKAAPSVSVSDPDVRLMKLPDGATRPAWNVQVVMSHGFVVTIEPTVSAATTAAWRRDWCSRWWSAAAWCRSVCWPTARR